jgi:hypothetical protein
MNNENKGYSTTIRMEPELYQNFKDLMARLKTRRTIYGRTFRITDLLGAICNMPEDVLNEHVDTFMKTCPSNDTLAAKVAKSSPEARSKIEAILAQEATKGQ